METTNRRSGIKIMASLIGLVKPLIHVMLLAIILGTLGYLCAISLTILASQVLIGTAGKNIFIMLIVFAVLRGVLHYAEQYCNHFIAFKILAIIRHKVFAQLRKLCPAKLEGKEKGNLISIITTDIELLEVFYAHTISPIAIAALTSSIMVIFIGSYNIGAGILALAGYCTVGIIIPMINGKKGSSGGMKFRNKFGELNSFVLDSLRGIDETIQYEQGQNQKKKMNNKSVELGKIQKVLSKLEGQARAFTNLAILVFSLAMMFLSLWLMQNGKVDFAGAVTMIVAMMGSFGPVVALANLSNNLNQTLASGERVLSLLEEKPLVEEIYDENNSKNYSSYYAENIINENFTDANSGENVEIHSDTHSGTHSGVHLSTHGTHSDIHSKTHAGASDVTFAYEDETILKDFSIAIKSGMITGIHGRSGSGKSTFLKLLMRFWDVNDGMVHVSGEDVRSIPTNKLRNTQSYVTQETQLFHDSIFKNIAIAKENATKEEVIEAAKKASIHDFIMTLPEQYDTKVGELGDTLSGGEKQRIGIARAFLHDAPIMLLDEPTSNLDSLNEGIILKSLKEQAKGKTVVLVSHRKSTMNVADKIYTMGNERVS